MALSKLSLFHERLFNRVFGVQFFTAEQSRSFPELLSGACAVKKEKKGQRSSVPGMTQYDEVDIDVGTAPGSLSLSTNAANARNKQVSQESDKAFEISGSQESSSSPK